MKKKDSIFRRTGAVLLSISLMFSMLLSMGLTEYSYAAADEEKAAISAEEASAPAAEEEAAPAEKPAAAQMEKSAALQSEAEAKDADPGEEADVKNMEFVGFSGDYPLELGTLKAGYTKKEAEDCRAEIEVRNTGNTVLSIDPADLSVGNSSKVEFAATGEPAELKPGETKVVGWVQPRHQQKPGTYATRVYFQDEDSPVKRINGTVGYYVTSRSCEVAVEDESGYDVESVALQSVLKGKIEDRSEILNLINYSSDAVSYEISSDNRLFDVEFEDPDDTGSDPLYMTGIVVKLDKKRAGSLDAGSYTGNIKVRAVTEEGSMSAEVRIPVSISITEDPCWKNKEQSSSWRQSDSEYFYEYVSILNTEAFGGDADKYLRAEISEGGEYFRLDPGIDSDGDVRLKTTGSLETGVYTAVIDLYYDSEGAGGEGVLCDSCTFTLEITADVDYEIEVINEELEDSTIDLGTLPKGYSARTAADHSVQLKIKNIGTGDLQFSPSCFRPSAYSKDPEAFVISSASKESVTVKPGEVYDAVSVAPAENMEPGSYEIDLYIYDDEGYLLDFIYIDYFVAKKGPNLGLTQTRAWYTEPEPVGKDGIDFGTVSPDQEARNLSRFVELTNEGNVPLRVRLSLENNKNDLFSYDPVWESGKTLQPGETTGIIVYCDTAKTGSLGTYKGDLKLSYFNTKSLFRRIRKIDVPLKLTKAEKEVFNVTLDFQGKGGYENRTVEAVKGTAYSDVVNQIMAEVMNVRSGNIPWPTDDEYAMIAITKKTDSELTGWDDAKEATDEIRRGSVTEDTTIYVNWAKKIDMAVLSLKAPECGADTSADPAIEPAVEDHYSISKASWTVEEGEEKFTGGKDYSVEAVLQPEFGWTFPTDADAMINGKHAKRDSDIKDTSSMTVSGIIRCEHDVRVWIPAGEKNHSGKCSKCKQIVYEKHAWNNGVVTIHPTCTKPGTKVYKCKVCGHHRYEAIPALGHDYEYTLKKKASGTEKGLGEWKCSRCGNKKQDEFSYKCTEGAGSTYYRGSKKMLAFTSMRENRLGDDFRPDPCFEGIRIDDTLYPVNVSGRKYTAMTYYKVETEVRFGESLCRDLADGEHTLTFQYADGDSETVKFNVAEPDIISEVDMTIGAPVCGESASRTYTPQEGEVITNPPVADLPDDAAYEIAGRDEGGIISSPFWTDSDYDSYWSGTFKGGETAYAYICLRPKEGSLFSLDDDAFNGVVKVNGVEIDPVWTRAYSDYMRFAVPVEAVHAWDEGTVTQEPTAEAEGKMIFACTSCGETREEIISNEKEKEAARKEAAMAEGTVHRFSSGTVKVTSKEGRTVAYIAAPRFALSAAVPDTVKIEGETFRVTEIASGAFSGCIARNVTVGANVSAIRVNAFSKSGVKTLTVRTTKLSKAGVAGSLKGSKVKTVKVKVGSKKTNKAYAKRYRSFFTKKNAGRKAKVK